MNDSKRMFLSKVLDAIIALHKHYWPRRWGGKDPGDFQEAFMRLRIPFLPPETLLYLLDGGLGPAITNMRWFQRVLGIHEHPESKPSAIAARSYLLLAQHKIPGFSNESAVELCDYVWFLRNRSTRYPSWGSSFAWRTSDGTIFKSNGPSVLVSSIVGLAFVDAFRATKEDRFLDWAETVAGYVMNENGHVKHKDGSICFLYSPLVRSEITNASAFAGLFLKSYSSVSDDENAEKMANKAYDFLVNNQNKDGSWFYYPSRPAHNNVIDNYHTGFILQALLESYRLQPASEIRNCLDGGLDFYHTMFEENGQPVFNTSRKYPVDIHDIAQGLFVFSLSQSVLGYGLKKAIHIWNYANSVMRRSDGRYASRRYRLGRSNFSTPRWADSWMFRGLTELYNVLVQK